LEGGKEEIRRKDLSNLLTRPTDEKRLGVAEVKSHPAPLVINLPTAAGEEKSTEEMREVI
jgi:hypothetical protein